MIERIPQSPTEALHFPTSPPLPFPVINAPLFSFITLFVFLSSFLKKKKESFSADVSVVDGRLVSVPPPSSQLDTRDKLWRLHSALLQCRSLLERAITKEEEELGDGTKADYETQRKKVKDRLSLLLINTGELLKAVDGAAIPTPSLDGLEVGTDVDRGVVMMVISSGWKLRRSLAISPILIGR